MGLGAWLLGAVLASVISPYPSPEPIEPPLLSFAPTQEARAVFAVVRMPSALPAAPPVVEPDQPVFVIKDASGKLLSVEEAERRFHYDHKAALLRYAAAINVVRYEYQVDGTLMPTFALVLGVKDPGVIWPDYKTWLGAQIRMPMFKKTWFAEGVTILMVNELLRQARTNPLARRTEEWSNATVSVDDLKEGK